MWKNCLMMEIRKLIAFVLILNLVTAAFGQEINSQNMDTVSEASFSEELSPVDTSHIGNSSVDPDSGMGLSKDTELGTDDNRKNEQNYRQPSIEGRGVPVASDAHSRASGTIVERKLLPPPLILPDTSDNSQADSSVTEPYKMGKTEKRILLITGAILVTGGLVYLLAKLSGKEESAEVDVGFPDPPPLPAY